MELLFRYRSRKSTCLLLIVGAFIISPVFGQIPQSARSEEAGEKEADRLMRQVFELTNRERTSRGLTALKQQKNLAEAAAWLASDMGKENYFDHTDSKKRDLSERLTDFGYKDYAEIAENIAAGQKSAADVVAGWMKSAGHRRNILNPDLREIGVGYCASPNSKYKRYWVQDFGKHFDH